MELGNFLKLLLRHKLTLIIVPVITVIITYFLVRNQPDVYTSEAQIATGIADQSQQLPGELASFQDAQVNQEFSNLIEMIRSRKILDQVSYQLIIHDLTSNTPYRKPSKLFTELNPAARKHALAVFTEKYQQRASLSLWDKDQNGLRQLLTSMRYDDQSIFEKLNVYRAQNSDFINMQFSSDDPQLSAFVVNMVSSEFISYYTTLVKENQRKAVNFLADLLKQKQDSLNRKLDNLKQYKIRNRVLNLNEQARALYGQIADFETKRGQAERDVESYKGAIRGIDKQFAPGERKYLESSLTRINQDIVGTRNELESLTNRYVESNFDDRYKRKADSVKQVLEVQVNQASDKYILNPLATKQNLVQQKITLQVERDLAQNSRSTIQRELDRLNAKLGTLVPHEAVVQADESAIDVASREYLEVLQKYNQTSMVSGFSIKLRQVEFAMPGLAQPSKKMLLVIISGVISFVFCLVVLFLLFFFDNTINSPRELANRTRIPVLGYLNRLSSSTIDLRQMWSDKNTDEEMRRFRHLLQSIRFEVDSELNGSKVLLINSLASAEGKTFLAMNLAYAYSLINKKVLLIDGNFINPTITAAVKTKFFIEDIFKGQTSAEEVPNGSRITIIGNRGGDGSLLETGSERTVNEKLDFLKSHFDIIIIETPALNTLNKSKEWVLFADKVLCVFPAGKSIKEKQKPNIEYLSGLNGKFIGWILNVVDGSQSAAEEED
jgi:succinoglycan biosynthesis transport protein ExoP